MQRLSFGGKANSKISEKCDLLYFTLSFVHVVLTWCFISFSTLFSFIVQYFLHTVCLKMRKTNSGSTYRVSCQRNPGCALKREMSRRLFILLPFHRRSFPSLRFSSLYGRSRNFLYYSLLWWGLRPVLASMNTAEIMLDYIKSLEVLYCPKS